MSEPGKPCPFCDRSQLEGRIVAENDLAYVIPTLGQIPERGGYMVVIPKEHTLCLGAATPEQLAAIRDYADAVTRGLRKEFGTATLWFEHGIVGQSVRHAHLHVLPVAEITQQVIWDFPQDVQALDDQHETGALAVLRENYQKRQVPYLFWQEKNRQVYGLASWNPPAPPRYLRGVYAKAVGRDVWENYAEVQKDPVLAAEDKRLIERTALLLKPYLT